MGVLGLNPLVATPCRRTVPNLGYKLSFFVVQLWLTCRDPAVGPSEDSNTLNESGLEATSTLAGRVYQLSRMDRVRITGF